jgi:hypothetical protein
MATWLGTRLRYSYIHKVVSPPVESYEPMGLVQRCEHLRSTIPVRVVDYERPIALNGGLADILYSIAKDIPLEQGQQSVQ